MGTEWTQFGVRLVILLLAPVITLVLVNLRSKPVESSRIELTPPAAVQEASGVEDASGVLPGSEEAFWAPHNSGSVAMRFEDRSNFTDERDNEQPRAFNSAWRLTPP
jgi:hypothetical protein